MPTLLETTLAQIQPLDPHLAVQAQQHLDRLTKPPGSLGRLEELARRYVAITGMVPPHIARKVVIVFAADHGVTAEGVSAYPQEVTAQMVHNFLRGGAAINALGRGPPGRRRSARHRYRGRGRVPTPARFAHPEGPPWDGQHDT